MYCTLTAPTTLTFYPASIMVDQVEKEKERAKKEQVVTQMTEVMENELQCIICSELFIQVRGHRQSMNEREELL